MKLHYHHFRLPSDELSKFKCMYNWLSRANHFQKLSFIAQTIKLHLKRCLTLKVSDFVPSGHGCPSRYMVPAAALLAKTPPLSLFNAFLLSLLLPQALLSSFLFFQYVKLLIIEHK